MGKSTYPGVLVIKWIQVQKSTFAKDSGCKVLAQNSFCKGLHRGGQNLRPIPPTRRVYMISLPDHNHCQKDLFEV